MNIKIKCSTGFTLPVSELKIYNSRLKKHSLLEIERIVDSIENDGFLFPLTVGKVRDKNYIIDGECTYYALCELKNRGYEIPEVPVYFVKCNEETIKKMILIATSTNHCVTETSLREFVKDTEIELKDYAFATGDIIDFFTSYDFERFFQKYKGCKKLVKDIDYGVLLTGGEI